MYKKTEFELKITEDDLLGHNGIDRIRLYCPYCGEYARFDAKHTIVIPEESLDPLGGHTRHFHTLAVCEFCKDVIYVKCFDWDWDPDWYFDYECHYPKSIECYINIDKLNIPVSFSEAFLRLQMGDYLTTVAICRKILKNMFIENGISEKITFANALKKIASGLDLPIHDEISSLTENLLRSFNIINSQDYHIHNITCEQAEDIYGLTKEFSDIVKNSEEFIEKQKARLNARSNKIFNPQDIGDIPF